MVRVFESIADCIGNTPVVTLRHPLVPSGKRLLLKLEYFNPSFSIKDRTGLGLVQAAMRSGALRPGGMLVESTSGNLGRALAMLGAAFGFRVIIVVDPKVSPSLLNFYRAFGAEVDVVTRTDALGGYQRTRLERVQELLALNPGAYWPNQYDNPVNPQFHYASTAEELLDLDFDLLVGSLSTGGHLCGLARRFRECRPRVRVVGCDVEGSTILGGHYHPYLVNGVGLSWRPGNTDTALLDLAYVVSDQAAFSACRLLARECGLLLGGSSGLAVCAAVAALAQTDAATALVMVADSGNNYLTQTYDDSWLAEHGVDLLGQEALACHLADVQPVLRSGRLTAPAMAHA